MGFAAAALPPAPAGKYYMLNEILRSRKIYIGCGTGTEQRSRESRRGAVVVVVVRARGEGHQPRPPVTSYVVAGCGFFHLHDSSPSPYHSIMLHDSRKMFGGKDAEIQPHSQPPRHTQETRSTRARAYGCTTIQIS